jgi:hypothetical protein
VDPAIDVSLVLNSFHGSEQFQQKMLTWMWDWNGITACRTSTFEGQACDVNVIGQNPEGIFRTR